ncbi:MAG: DEAD/DEAH box helicase [Nanoarchaeota archaeon]|nr:DEAD/DEAH box helicase [Nanoarchaeota archaeon]
MEFLKEISPRDYQQKIFETCRDKNCLVVLPTGLGKTLIALMLAIDRSKRFPGEKILFLAPTRPLAEQHLKFFKEHLPELFGSLELFTGSVSAEKRKNIWKSADVIFSTPQCIANDLRNNLYNLSEVSLLIEDEAHRCIRNYDYTYVAEQYRKNALHQRVLGLTASPGSDTAKIREICKNLSIEDVELRTRESEDIKHNLQELEFEKIQVDLPSEFIELREIIRRIHDEYIDELKSRGLLYEIPTKVNLIKLQAKLIKMISNGNRNFNLLKGMSACASAIKLQHALELIETQTLFGFNSYLKDLVEQSDKSKSKAVQFLVKKPGFNLALVKSKLLLENGAEHPKISELVDLIESEKSSSPSMKVIVFSQYRDTASLIAKKLNGLSGINARIFVGQLKKKDTGLSQKEQKKTIEEFSSGKINVLCATSIGEEGLDIPEVSLVVFYEPVASAIRAIQRAGRTARLQKGKLIVLITKKTRDESYYYVSRRKEKKMHSAIEEIKKDLSSESGLEFQRTL